MNILSIESSCDDTAVAIVKNGRKILSSKTSSQINEHKIYGGVVPEVASRRHIESIYPLVNSVLCESGLSLKNLDALAVTYAPGLVGSLLVGVNFAKGLSLATGLPIVPVHHIRAHIASLYITYPNLTPPFLCLVVSGGHSHLIEVSDYTDMKILGKTRDDAAGEAFDKVGRKLGFDYPGGIALDKIADLGDPHSFKLPIPLSQENDTCDFSFSGLKTSMINIINNFSQKNIKLPVEDLSASFRHCVINYLVCITLRALKKYGYKTLCIAGGVSANSLLRCKMQEECEKHKINFFKPLNAFCGDNAAMVGSQAYYEFLNGKKADLNLNACATLSVEKG